MYSSFYFRIHYHLILLKSLQGMRQSDIIPNRNDEEEVPLFFPHFHCKGEIIKNSLQVGNFQ